MPNSRSPSQTNRSITINLRADRAKRALIDRAAERLGKNRSEFMLDASCREAAEVLLDHRLFLVDETTYKNFVRALDASPAANKRLKRLLMQKAPWER
ncbi:MAG TPA: DUF1778 domain-containing protein [Candidatus Acidoferrales bacterium]|nr:DUF1778 domain-containing protein [Candidatus Acidoferrales bacterium]